MYKLYVSRYAKNCDWFEVEVTDIEDTDVKDKFDKSKLVFTAQNENGSSNKCIYWSRINLNIGDRLQIYGYKKQNVFICRNLKRLQQSQ
jgi:hypothetical protein